jgi:hypothetical protein
MRNLSKPGELDPHGEAAEAVSNHEATESEASSFETRSALLRMRREGIAAKPRRVITADHSPASAKHV